MFGSDIELEICWWWPCNDIQMPQVASEEHLTCTVYLWKTKCHYEVLFHNKATYKIQRKWDAANKVRLKSSFPWDVWIMAGQPIETNEQTVALYSFGYPKVPSVECHGFLPFQRLNQNSVDGFHTLRESQVFQDVSWAIRSSNYNVLVWMHIWRHVHLDIWINIPHLDKHIRTICINMHVIDR